MMTSSPASPVPVAGAAAVTALGLEWRGISHAVARDIRSLQPSRQLSALGTSVDASEVAPVSPADDVGDARSRMIMCRAAHLAAIALHRALLDAGWKQGCEDVGYFLGIGGSGGPMGELGPMLAASAEGGRLSLDRFAGPGLSSANPLLAFHLLNSYILSHGAILERLGGPNAAFFSRGNGTHFALAEALVAIEDGDCERAVAGGADSAVHPGAWLELARAGQAQKGLVPGEGAALLAISRRCDRPLALIEACACASGRDASLEEAVDQLTTIAAMPLDSVILAPWGAPTRELFDCVVGRRFPGAQKLDLTRCLGYALAATPAIAWVCAVDLLTSGEAQRVLALSAGVDGGAEAVVFQGVPR